MKEVCRALPVTEWERRLHLQGMLLYFRSLLTSLSLWLIDPQRMNVGIFTFPLDVGEAMAEKEKAAVAWCRRPPRPPEGYSSSEVTSSSAQGTRCCLWGDTFLKTCISALISVLSLAGDFCMQSVPLGHFVRMLELHVFCTPTFTMRWSSGKPAAAHPQARGVRHTAFPYSSQRMAGLKSSFTIRRAH